MDDGDFNLSEIPTAYQTGFGGFARSLAELAGDNLRGLSAFGGWVVGDPFYAEAAAQSVVVLERFDLDLLDRLAVEGQRFGQRRVRAPLIMTPEYIRGSCDTFPLELLEIQQLNALVCGRDYFADLQFEPRHVRVQAERELKSELIQLRQGLLSVAGRHKALADLCLACSERSIRVLRGVLHLCDDKDVPKRVSDVATRAAEVTGVTLDTLRNLLVGDAHSNLDVFARFYAEVEALAAYVDAHVA